MPFSHLIRRTTSRGQSAFLLVLPHGGQNLARRNAWDSMAQDSTRARARRDADLAMSRAQHRVAASG